MPQMPMQHDVDPAEAIMNKIGMRKGKLPAGYEPMGNRILLGVYDRPQVTKSGIYLSDKTRDEEKNQGKSCLVLAKGPNAFVSDGNYDFAGQNVEVGDWVAIWVYNARPLIINGQACRMVRDTDIEMKIPGPDQIF